jgi:NAD+ kinase
VPPFTRFSRAGKIRTTVAPWNLPAISLAADYQRGRTPTNIRRDGMTGSKIGFVAAQTERAQRALANLVERYGQTALDQADVIVALGGDGFMLETLHRVIESGQPVYGMHRGTVGFLMNNYSDKNLPERLARSEQVTVHPLRMTATRMDGAVDEALAINEVSLLRQQRQTAKIRIEIDGIVRLPELMCDGVLVSTPAGSTAYNLSVHGPILPLRSPILALTPISAFRPRRWRGALLPQSARVRFAILETDKRPVSAVADFTEVRDVMDVLVREDRSLALHMLFDPGHGLEERILREQFLD